MENVCVCVWGELKTIYCIIEPFFVHFEWLPVLVTKRHCPYVKSIEDWYLTSPKILPELKAHFFGMESFYLE